jgi:hypothetical protein
MLNIPRSRRRFRHCRRRRLIVDCRRWWNDKKKEHQIHVPET